MRTLALRQIGNQRLGGPPRSPYFGCQLLQPVLPAGTFWGGIALGLGIQGGVAMLALGLSKRL